MSPSYINHYSNRPTNMVNPEPQYSIEARSLDILAFGGHDFWVLRDEKGRALAELHGLATERATNRWSYMGTDAQKYSLRIWQFAHDPEYARDHGVLRTDDSYIKSNQSFHTVLFAGRSEAMARWNAAIDAMTPLNDKDIDYPALGVNITHDTINSNSAYRTLGEIMGLPIKNFSGRIEPGIDHRIASPEEIERWRDPHYLVLTQATTYSNAQEQSQGMSPSQVLSEHLDRMIAAMQAGDGSTFSRITQTLANSPAAHAFYEQVVNFVEQQEQQAAQQAMQPQVQQNPEHEAPVMRIRR